MRDVTEAELRDYFRAIDTNELKPDHFTQQQASMIGDAARECKLARTLLKAALEMREADYKPEDFLISMWVQAFQMGREFEDRLFTEAIKNGRLDLPALPGVH